MVRAVNQKDGPRPDRGPVQAKVRRRQVDRSDLTRTALIRAAIDTVGELGFAGTTAAGIAARAKVTRGALQHHFGTIQDLYLAVVRYVSHELVGEIEAEISVFGSLDHRVGAIADRYWKVYGGADYFALIEIWTGSRGNDAFRAQIEDLMKQITVKRNEYWRALLADYPLSDLELDTMRGALLAVVRGAAVHRTFSRDDDRALRQIRFVFSLARKWLEEKASSDGLATRQGTAV
jgi:AcrR family transcriptional regulator